MRPVLMAGAGALLRLFSLRWGAPPGRFSMPWWVLVPAVLVSNAMVFHLEIQGEAHSFYLSELPLVVGCFFMAPWAVIVGRLAGEGLAVALRRGQSRMKLAFNMALFLLETTLRDRAVS